MVDIWAPRGGRHSREKPRLPTLALIHRALFSAVYEPVWDGRTQVRSAMVVVNVRRL